MKNEVTVPATRRLSPRNTPARRNDPFAKVEAEIRALTDRISWVRRLEIGHVIVGLGYAGEQLVFIRCERLTGASVGPVELRDSVQIMLELSSADELLGLGHDVDDEGWKRWLRQIHCEL